MEDRLQASGSRLQVRQKKQRRIGAIVGVVIVAAVLVCWMPRRAEADVFGDVVVTYEPTAHAETSHGYLEHRFRVTNRSKADAHSVAISFDSGGRSGEACIESLRRSTEVGPGSTVLVTLPQPPLPLVSGRGVRVYIDGRRNTMGVSNDDHGITGGYSYRRSSPDQLVLMVGRNITGNMENFLESSLPGDLEVTRAEHPVSDWSASWMAYTRFDAVVVTAEEMNTMNAGARDGLWRWVEAGGTLAVLGEWNVPRPWADRAKSLARCRSVSVGFGQCLVMTGRSRDTLDSDTMSELSRSLQRTAAPFRANRDIEEANRTFRIVEELRIPVRGLFAMMLVFAVAIGPVNLIVLSRRKRRIWMLWTIPLISLVASGAVFGYAIFAEGWSGYRRTQAMTILDEASHRATTIGWTGFYSPMTPGDGLHFGYETELTPQVGSTRGTDGRARSVDWTEDQHLVTGWVTSRVPAHFLVRKSEIRRERLSVQKGGGNSRDVVNGLGARIEQVWIADEEGRIFYGSQVEAGAKATLQAAAGASHAVGRPEALRDLFGGTWLREPEMMTRQPQNYLRPNTYIAVLSDVPFVESGLASASSKEMKNIVYGIMGEDEGAD